MKKSKTGTKEKKPRRACREPEYCAGTIPSAEYEQYRDDPVGYCREVLNVALTPDQEEIARAVIAPPYKTLVRAGHNVGKSFVAACLVNWWYDTRRPGIVLTTAPTERQVHDILWKEVRRLRPGSKDWRGPYRARLQDAPDHYAHGFTARDGDSFQGHHAPNVFIVFDEAVGVAPIFWEAAQPMLAGDSYAFLGIYNPTDQGSVAYREEHSGDYRLLTMSCLDHPNIHAEQAGRPAPYPAAVRWDRLCELIAKWSERVEEADARPLDVRLPTGWFRPGPVAEARLLGRWPTLAINSVWSLTAWQLAEALILPLTGRLQIGCDVARFGDDLTAIHVRLGGVSLHHETHSGWNTLQTARRLQELCHEFGQQHRVHPQRVPVAVDETGIGGGVVDFGQAARFHFVPVLSAQQAADPSEFPNRRSALWFGTAEEARRGNLSFVRLPVATRETLREELLTPTYSIDARGRRVVEPKERTKDRLRRSPDNADAVNLAYASVAEVTEWESG